MAPRDSSSISSSDLLFKAGTRAQLAPGQERLWHRTDRLQVSLFTDLHLSPCNSWLQLQHVPPTILSPASPEPSYPKNAILMCNGVRRVRTPVEPGENTSCSSPCLHQAQPLLQERKIQRGRAGRAPKYGDLTSFIPSGERQKAAEGNSRQAFCFRALPTSLYFPEPFPSLF